MALDLDNFKQQLKDSLEDIFTNNLEASASDKAEEIAEAIAQAVHDHILTAEVNTTIPANGIPDVPNSQAVTAQGSLS